MIDNIGINIHLSYTDGDYKNYDSVIADLGYLGITLVRDRVPNPNTNGGGGKNYGYLADAGIRFDLNASAAASDFAGTMTLIENFVAAHPGSVVAIEGANEVDKNPVSYDGLTGQAAALALQSDIYDYVHTSTTLEGIATWDLTGITGGTDFADASNAHIYPRNGNQPQDRLGLAIETTLAAQPDRPMVITEGGYYTLPGQGWGGVDATTQSIYTINYLLDAVSQGVSTTFLYQLLDAYTDTTGTDIEKHFGLFDADNNPKQAAVALHNFTTILSDTGASATTFAVDTLDYDVTGWNSYGHSYLFEKSDGTFDIALWYEQDIWDEVNLVPIATTSTAIDLALGSYFRVVEVFDPQLGTGAIATYHDVDHLDLLVNQDALIVQLEPNGANAAPTIEGVNPQQVVVGDDLTLSFTSDMISDANGDTVLLNATLANGSALPSWLTFDPDTWTLSGVATQTGKWSILLTASDHYGGASSLVFQLSVTSQDHEQTPTITGDGTIIGTKAADVIAGGDNSDTINASSGADIVYGHAGNDLINGGGDADDLYGGAGNDTLRGDAGADRLFGQGGDDTLAGGGGGFDLLTGGAGADTFIFRGKESTGPVESVEGFLVVQHARIADLDFAEGDRLQLSYFVDSSGVSLQKAVGLSANIDSLSGLGTLVHFLETDDPSHVIADASTDTLTLILKDSNGGLHALELLHYATIA
ncbi:putative Ig domain-containing protein [Arboricoccus pini]|nr:putative Ig domain-containing protein [Arboricoccus pini]